MRGCASADSFPVAGKLNFCPGNGARQHLIDGRTFQRKTLSRRFSDNSPPFFVFFECSRNGDVRRGERISGFLQRLLQRRESIN